MPTDPTPDWLDEVERACAEATAGPWEADGGRVLVCDARRTIVTESSGSPSNPAVIADAAFIALARTALPTLLAAYRAKVAECEECDRVRAALSRAAAWLDRKEATS